MGNPGGTEKVPLGVSPRWVLTRGPKWGKTMGGPTTEGPKAISTRGVP
jgi:hypothetical protein